MPQAESVVLQTVITDFQKKYVIENQNSERNTSTESQNIRNMRAETLRNKLTSTIHEKPLNNLKFGDGKERDSLDIVIQRESTNSRSRSAR